MEIPIEITNDAQYESGNQSFTIALLGTERQASGTPRIDDSNKCVVSKEDAGLKNLERPSCVAINDDGEENQGTRHLSTRAVVIVDDNGIGEPGRAPPPIGVGRTGGSITISMDTRQQENHGGIGASVTEYLIFVHHDSDWN